MTYIDAIKVLKEEIHEEVPRAAITAREHNEAIKTAIEAMERFLDLEDNNV